MFLSHAWSRAIKNMFKNLLSVCENSSCDIVASLDLWFGYEFDCYYRINIML